jgi:D-alanyl-D-alanine dipeptidase
VLYVWDAYRPVTCQEGLWAFLSKQVATQFPHASAEEKINYTLKFLSDPTGFVRTDPTTWPVHSTGGAVDLTLRDLATGKLLDMGAGFDETEDISYSDAFERKLAAHEIAENYPALVNRRLLHTAMTREGFVNYPLEFWHFDYGDQMYILHSHLLGLPQTPSAAWYGYMESPEAN